MYAAAREAVRPRARRRGSDADRSEDLPLPRPRVWRRRRLHGARREGGRDGEGSCAALPQLADRSEAVRARPTWRRSNLRSIARSTRRSASRWSSPMPDLSNCSAMCLPRRSHNEYDHRRARQVKPMNTIQAVNLALDEAMGLDRTSSCSARTSRMARRAASSASPKACRRSTANSRVRSTPISEQAIIGAAIGASIVGMRPVAEIMLMNFTAVAMDMIVNHAAKLRFMSGGQTHVPITIRTMTGAGFGTGGQHADYLEAWFAHTAGMKVVAPSSPADAYGLMLSCIFDDDPCLFIENMPTYWTPGAAPQRGAAHPARQGERAAQGRRRHCHQLQPSGERLRRPSRTSSRRKASRSSSSICAPSLRWDQARRARLRREDAARGGRA